MFRYMDYFIFRNFYDSVAAFISYINVKKAWDMGVIEHVLYT